MKKAKTGILASFQKAFRIAQLSNESKKSISHIEEESYKAGYSRRKFIKDSAKATIIIGASSLIKPLSSSNFIGKTENVRVAIVGGGIAGLNAAYQLKKMGIDAIVYEGSNRMGGRIFTKTDFIPNYSTEFGGEFIDTDHKDMIDLAKEFGLKLTDKLTDNELIEEGYFFNEKKYSLREVIEEFKNIQPKIKADKDSLDEKYSNDASIKLDNISINEYLQKLGTSEWFTKLLNMAYTSEFGIESSEQSALNFITLIGTENTDSFEIFGESDERFKIEGGNSKLIEVLTDKMKAQIRQEYKLTAIKQTNSNYTLVFDNNKEIKADFVVLAIPFTILRDVELNVSGISNEKKLCIRKLGYGTNSKLIMAYNNRVWRKEGYAGYIFNEIIQNGWDNSRMQNNNTGMGAYTCFVGGQTGVDYCNDSNNEIIKDLVLAEMDRVFKNAKTNFNGKFEYAKWLTNPYVKGSYSGYKIGQWTTIYGREIEPIGNIFFAGEHCSSDFQGYMNGGAETGRLAAENIAAQIKKKVPGHV